MQRPPAGLSLMPSASPSALARSPTARGPASPRRTCALTRWRPPCVWTSPTAPCGDRRPDRDRQVRSRPRWPPLPGSCRSCACLARQGQDNEAAARTWCRVERMGPQVLRYNLQAQQLIVDLLRRGRRTPATAGWLTTPRRLAHDRRYTATAGLVLDHVRCSAGSRLARGRTATPGGRVGPVRRPPNGGVVARPWQPPGVTGHAVRHQATPAARTRMSSAPRHGAVAPATFNTLNQWAAGINNTLALGLLNELLHLQVPIVKIAMYVQDRARRPPGISDERQALPRAGATVLEAERSITGRDGTFLVDGSPPAGAPQQSGSGARSLTERQRHYLREEQVHGLCRPRSTWLCFQVGIPGARPAAAPTRRVRAARETIAASLFRAIGRLRASPPGGPSGSPVSSSPGSRHWHEPRAASLRSRSAGVSRPCRRG